VTCTYLVECYWPGASEAQIAAAAQRAELAARDLSVVSGRVAHLRSLVVPQDEIVLCFFEADSTELVREASVRAGLPFERIVASVQVESGAGAPSSGQGRVNAAKAVATP
jgi:hypothetical protein